MSINKIKEKGKKIAAHLLEASPQDIEYADGQFQVEGSPQKAVALRPGGAHRLRAAQLSRRPRARARGDEPSTIPPTSASRSARTPAWSRSSRTPGTCKILRYVAVDDVGNVISPMIVDGMVHGGIAQGVGQALWEGAVYDGESGQLVSGTMMDYALPRADMLPLLRDRPHRDADAGQPARHQGRGRDRAPSRPRRPSSMPWWTPSSASAWTTSRRCRSRAERVWTTIQAARAEASRGPRMYPAAVRLPHPRLRSRTRSICSGQHKDDAKLLAGGHSLLPAMKFRLARPAHVVDLQKSSRARRDQGGGRHPRHRGHDHALCRRVVGGR